MDSRSSHTNAPRLNRREIRAICASLGYAGSGEWPFEDEVGFDEDDLRSAHEKMSVRLSHRDGRHPPEEAEQEPSRVAGHRDTTKP